MTTIEKLREAFVNKFGSKTDLRGFNLNNQKVVIGTVDEVWSWLTTHFTTSCSTRVADVSQCYASDHKTDWEKEFDNKFNHDSGDEYNSACLLALDYTRPIEDCDCQIKEIKAFIRSLLSHQRQELLDQVDREVCPKCRVKIKVISSDKL